MKNTILGFILSCFMFFFLMGNSLARDSQEDCNREYKDCMESCFQSYKRVVYDVWGNCINGYDNYGNCKTDSDTTYVNRKNCNNSCRTGLNDCTQRITTEEREERKIQEEQDNQVQGTQKDTTRENPSSPSNSPFYTWKDKNGVIHITNKTESIPPEYQEQQNKVIEKQKETFEEKRNKIIEKMKKEEVKGKVLEDIQKEKERESVINELEQKQNR